MRGFLRFFSLSVANQFCALLYQVVLLPLQLRIWGHEVAAHWFVFIATANLISVFDLGLRNAGHSQLLTSVRTGDPTALHEFRQTWALTRLLMFCATAVFLVYELFMGTEPAVLTVTVIISYAIDTVIMVRGVWYDTLGDFSRVEVGFLAFNSLRLSSSILALAVFQALPETLGWIMFITAIGGLVAQACLFPRYKMLGLWAGGFLELRWRSLAVIRFVVADPMMTWMRISLPVIVVGTIASAEVVATYVALRAVFGFARQIVGQLNRYGSVKYVQLADSNRTEADSIVARVILGCTVINVGVASAAIADRGRILRIWLGLDTNHEFAIILAFAVGTVIFSYQVVSNVLMRSGDVAGVARRQYCYLLAAGIAALIACFSGIGLLPYLVLLALQEVLIGGLFVGSLGHRIMLASIVAFSIATVVLALVVFVVNLHKGLFINAALPVSMILSCVIAALAAISTLAASLLFEFAGESKTSGTCV